MLDSKLLLFAAAILFLSVGPVLAQPTQGAVDYNTSVVYEDEVDTQAKAQIEQRVFVSGKVTEEALRSFLQERYRSLSDRGGFTHFDSPTNIFVYVFGSKEEAEKGGAGWMAAAMKGFSDEKPTIQVKSDQVEYYNQGSEVRLGIEEGERKEIFKAFVRAEDRARARAQDKYPSDFEQQREVQDRLQKKYDAEVREKYGITEAVQDSIMNEGFEKQWPFPKEQ